MVLSSAGLSFGELGTIAPVAFGGLVLAAVLIGFAKTAVGGVALISVAIFAATLPSRVSTGVVLGLLMVGDLVAVRVYHAHADWRMLLRLIPAVAIGLGVGVFFIARVDDTVMRRAIGVVLVLLVGAHLWMRRRAPGTAPEGRATARWGFGTLAGFTTMVANAGGPPMALYLLYSRYTMLGFLGTTSWFFFVLNATKVPFSVGLGLITADTLRLNATLAPAVLLGTWIGRRVIGHMKQDLFDRLILATTAISGLYLMR